MDSINRIAALLDTTEQTKANVATYESLVKEGDLPAINSFVDGLCEAAQGSDADRLCMELVILHHDVTRLKADDEHCINLFATSNNLWNEATELGMPALADEFGVLALRVMSSHTKCIMHWYNTKPVSDSAIGNRRFLRDLMVVAATVAAGAVFREICRRTS